MSKKKKRGSAAGPSPAAAPAELDRKARKELWTRAKYINKEIPRLLHKHRDNVPDSIMWSLADGTRELRAQLNAGKASLEWRRFERSVSLLDQAADKSIGLYRKSHRRQYFESIAGALLIALFIRAFLFEAYRIPSGSMIPTLMVGDYLFVSKFVYGVSVPFTNIRVFSLRDPARGEVVIFGHPEKGDQEGEILIKRVMAVAGDRVRMENNVWYVNGQPQGNATVLQRDGPCFLSEGEGCTLRDAATHRVLKDHCPCTLMTETSETQTWHTQHISNPAGTICVCRDVERGVGVTENHPDWPEPVMFPTSRYLPQYPAPATDWVRFDDDGNQEMEVPKGYVLVLGDNRDNSDDGRSWGLVPLENIKGKALIIWLARDLKDRIFRFVH